MKRLMLGSLASACVFAAMLPAQADESITTQTINTSAPQVVDSYMKPTVTQTKSVTAADGTTQTTTAPMVMERHEKVILPSTDVKTTTTEISPRVVTEDVVNRVAPAKRRVVHHYVAYHPRKKYVAHKPVHRAIAYSHVRKTIVEPRVIQQTQTIEHHGGAIIDRKDPALED